MVLMDVSDAEGMIAEVGRLLNPGGRFVATLFHPCFSIVDGSSWLIEEKEFDTQVSVRIWRYREPFAAAVRAKSAQPVPTMGYHRPLSWYVERLTRHGLLIDALDEPLPTEDFSNYFPELGDRIATIPVILVIGAVKTGAGLARG